MGTRTRELKSQLPFPTCYKFDLMAAMRHPGDLKTESIQNPWHTRVIGPQGTYKYHPMKGSDVFDSHPEDVTRHEWNSFDRSVYGHSVLYSNASR